MSKDIVEILKEPEMTKISAPMVRYSKLQFRNLVRRYNCDICFTPMILADSFILSAKARDNEFTTNEKDRPLVVQFAAKTINDFVGAAEMVSPYCDGVDLNCGCPQRWAIKDGYGAELLKKPQLVKDLVYQLRNRIPNPFTVSVKIRLLKDIRQTIDLCQTIEKAGASFLTVHARTPDMRCEPIDLNGLKLVKDCVRLPVIANGDVKNIENAQMLYEETNCEGIMAARGILTNPALFAGYSTTPLSCVQDWLDITESIPTQFICFHRHLVFMMEKVLSRQEKMIFNNLQDKSSVLEFLDTHYHLKPNASVNALKPIECNFNEWNSQCTNKTSFHCNDDLPNDCLGNIFQE